MQEMIQACEAHRRVKLQDLEQRHAVAVNAA